MSSQNPMHARVLRMKLARRSVAAGLVKLEAMCAAGAACPEVQASPLAAIALDALQKATAAASASLTAFVAAKLALRAAVATLHVDFRAADVVLRVYEGSVARLARGNAAIIAGAGLLARAVHTPPAALGDVTEVKGGPGRQPREAILTWPPVKGATGYAIEVSFTPDDPAGAWTALTNGSIRRRLIRAPAPGARLLARVAAVASDGTRSAWSTPILVTAR